MQKNIYLSTFPQNHKASQNALTFGIYAKNNAVFLKKMPKYKKLYRNLCAEYGSDGILEDEIMHDIALFYAEKELILQAKTAKIKESMFKLLSDPDLPCYATGGQAPAFQNAAAHHIYNLLTSADKDMDKTLKKNSVLLEEAEGEYVSAMMQKKQLEKEMAFLPDPHQDYEIYKEKCDQHFEKFSENYNALKEYIHHLEKEALPPLYNIMIALLYKQEIWSYLEQNAVLSYHDEGQHLDRKLNSLDKKIEAKIALYFKIKQAKKL